MDDCVRIAATGAARGSWLALDARMDARAAEQYAVMKREHLELGLSAQAIGRRLRVGRLRLIHRGVYLVGPVMPPLACELAAIYACGPDATLSHHSASYLWEIRPRPAPQPDILCDAQDVLVPSADRVRRPGINVRRCSDLRPDERTVHRKILVTTPARTLLDLARVLGTRELEQAVARAEREGLVTLADLHEMVNRHRGQPGTPALRALIEAEIGPQFTRSPLETELRDLVRRAGLPMPRMNVRMGPYELDALWPDANLAVEVDGFAYHSRRPRYEGDRVRDAWLLARGIQVLRLSARQIRNDPLPTAVQLAQTLTRASRNE